MRGKTLWPLAAAALVREGYSVSLARDLDTEQSVDNPSPFAAKMNPPVDGQFNMDEYRIFFHGFAHTHLDTLSHVFYEGRMYNTGRWARRADKGLWDIGTNSAGLSARCARWLKSRNIAMLGGDAASDALPSRIPGVSFPIHQLVMVAMGTPMLDQCQLEELTAACAARKRWSFLLTLAPLRVKGGTGAPVNPIATF
jgi:kynurenine formamidase